MSSDLFKSSSWLNRTRYLCIFVLFAFLTACEGGSSDPDTLSNLTYTTNSTVYTVGIAITPNTPTNSGGEVSSYSVSPALPAGLSLNTSTGVISGTPSGATGTATYTITASNSKSDTTAILSITVNAAAADSTVTLNTTSASMDPGSQRVFMVTVTGIDDTSVIWSTIPAETGTLTILNSNNIAYTAPATAGQIQLIATSVGDPTATATVTITVSATAAQTETIFYNGNIGGVSNGGASPSFTIDVPRHIVYFDTYHYFNGGALPGLLSLRHSDGTVYGPWQTTGGVGQGGVQNASWICYPDVDIKAGTYTIVDSDPSTWSQNGESSGLGFAHLTALTITEAISDRRLKKDIVHLATLENGIELYSFKYLWDDKDYVGVMAQDLLKDSGRKSAVRLTDGNYYVVNYQALGLKMITLREWLQSPQNIYNIQNQTSIQQHIAMR